MASRIITPEKPWFIYDQDLIVPKANLYKVEFGNRRLYYRFVSSKEKVRFYYSVTTYCGDILPLGDALKKWQMDLGEEKARYIMSIKAHYGNMMHGFLLDFLIKGQQDPNNAEDVVLEYCEKERIMHEYEVYGLQWVQSLKQDLLAWAQFCHDHKVKPLAIEVPVYNDYLRLAGRIDLIAEITIQEKGFWGEVYKSGPRKGQPKETKKDVTIKGAMIDLKSGRKAFYDSHVLQLNLYKQIWNKAFGDVLPIERIYNWSPSDWKTSPGGKLKDQTETKSKRWIECYRLLATCQDPPSKRIFHATAPIKLGESAEGKFEIHRLNEYIKRKHKGMSRTKEDWGRTYTERLAQRAADRVTPEGESNPSTIE